VRLKKKLIVATIALTIITAGCSSATLVYEENKEEPTINNSVYEDTSNEAVLDKTSEVLEETKEENQGQKVEIDLQEVKPNEAGQVMVLMYHAIGEPEAEFRRTSENLRQDLKYLYDNGYRPISLNDYVNGNITTEAGYTPIVLTFDDGWQDNFSMIEDEKGEWVIDPNSAITILEKFHEEYPDFPLEATFFINDNPFEQQEHLEYKLKYIVEKGMDIGNHTLTHVNFTSVDITRIKKEISAVSKLVNKYLTDYDINTLALPFGSRPKKKELYKYLESGSYEGVDYNNIAILNVGWDPYKSPYHKDFNPLSIHRVRASDLQEYVDGVGMYDWLKRFEKGERTRFISDGDPNIVTVPVNFKEVVDESKTIDKEIRTYELVN
jgi:peptidoglycan/xylan/chitin deacetylase (PgdA/CDA1 family)